MKGQARMKWFIGIDGGGTKTSFAIGKNIGDPVQTLTRGGCSYLEIGIPGVIELLQEGIHDLLLSAEVRREACAGCCIGLPCYGENKEIDQQITRLLQEVLSPIPLKIVNDSIVGWAGSLECQEGIHLVAGTGSMAVGRGADGSFARSGGWTEFFGDEGSCYWIGREAMKLFSQESDGRLPKGALYEIVKNYYSLHEDFDFIEKVLDTIAPHRDQVAAFQRIALEAALAGDYAVQTLYRQAAEELASIVVGVKTQLSWSGDKIKVSYYGGLFHAGDLVLKPLTYHLAAHGCTLQKPLHSATEGALLLAIQTFSK